MDVIFLLLFVAVLVFCVVADISIICALLAGFVIFAFYALKRGFSVKDVAKMSVSGVKTAKNVLITMFLIGVLTGLWREGGTIPAVVCSAVKIMHPDFFVLAVFLVNCIVSFLTGTAFGTAATMGAICMTVANTLGVNPVFVGGAILSGAYFGDRCSFVSTSALLVSELTKTKLHDNVKVMAKSAFVPFAFTCLIYLVYGLSVQKNAVAVSDVGALFESEFKMGFAAFLPAAAILVLSFAKVNVKTTMLASIAVSVPVCLFNEKSTLSDILTSAVFGFEAKNEALSSMINGGGAVSMIRVVVIVCISSCYSGIFEETGLLDSVKKTADKMSRKFSSFAAVLASSVLSSIVSCNQTLSIMLTHQLCCDVEKDNKKLALFLENSAVVLAPLVPWSIAGATPLASSGSPESSFLTAFFLMLVPIWQLVCEKFPKKHNN